VLPRTAAGRALVAVPEDCGRALIGVHPRHGSDEMRRSWKRLQPATPLRKRRSRSLMSGGSWRPVGRAALPRRHGGGSTSGTRCRCAAAVIIAASPPARWLDRIDRVTEALHLPPGTVHRAVLDTKALTARPTASPLQTSRLTSPYAIPHRTGHTGLSSHGTQPGLYHSRYGFLVRDVGGAQQCSSVDTVAVARRAGRNRR
jgi:hypothetical protein